MKFSMVVFSDNEIFYRAKDPKSVIVVTTTVKKPDEFSIRLSSWKLNFCILIFRKNSVKDLQSSIVIVC